MYSPKRSNCILWAVQQWRRHGGYVAFRRSHYGWWPHALWSPDLKTWLGYSPFDPKLKACPPPLFRGHVVEEIFYDRGDWMSPFFYATPPCTACGQPMPYPDHVCDAIAVAASIAHTRSPLPR